MYFQMPKLRLPCVAIQLLVHLQLIHSLFAAVDDPHRSKKSDENERNMWVEKKLYHHLLSDYDPNSRPVVDDLTQTVPFKNLENKTEHIQQITVEHGLSLIQILDLNEMDQVLTTSVRSLMRWTDYHLIWSPTDYDNITSINIPTNKIWLPDVALYNYADERLQEKRDCNAVVSNTGRVEWSPMGIFKSTCSVQIKKFPFDKQACKMKFGVWSFDGLRVNITLYNNFENFQTDDYRPSPEWDVLESRAVFSEQFYQCCPEPYPDITYYIWIKRRAAFYNYILILPCFLLSSLTLVLFWLPPETPAKMVLGMNIFVAFFLLLLLLEDSIPSASSTFPILGTYFCLSMIIITLSSFLCLIIVNFHFRGDSRMEVPHWLKKMTIQYGAKYLWVNVGQVTAKKPEPVLPPSQDTAAKLPPNSLQLFRQQSQPHAPAAMQHSYSQHGSHMYIGGQAKSKQNPPLHQQQQRTLLYNEFGESAIFSGPWVPESTGQPCIPPVRGPYETSFEMQQQSQQYNYSAFPHQGGRCSGPPDHRQRIGQWSSSNPQNPFSGTVFTPTVNEGLHAAIISTTSSNRGKQAHFVEKTSQPQPLLKNRNLGNTTTTDDEDENDDDDDSRGTKVPAKFEDVLMDVIQAGAGGENRHFTPQKRSSSSRGNTNPSVPNFSTSRRIHMITKDVNDIVKCLRTIQKINETKEKTSRVMAEWRSVGMVLDRLFFVIYLITITLTSTLFFTDESDDVQVGNHLLVK